MKATVIKSENGKTLILTEEGVFRNIEGSYETGRIIEYNKWQAARPKRTSQIRRIVAAAAACIMIVLCIGSLTVMKPAAAVSLGDSFPIQYMLDDDGKVLSVRPVNKDGDELARKLTGDGVKGKNISEAINMAEEITGSRYDAEDEPPVIECKDEAVRKELDNEIRETHSGNYKNDDTHKDKNEEIMESGSAEASAVKSWSPADEEQGKKSGEEIRQGGEKDGVHEEGPQERGNIDRGVAPGGEQGPGDEAGNVPFGNPPGN